MYHKQICSTGANPDWITVGSIARRQTVSRPYMPYLSNCATLAIPQKNASSIVAGKGGETLRIKGFSQIYHAFCTPICTTSSRFKQAAENTVPIGMQEKVLSL